MKKMSKRILSLLLCMAMVLSLFPLSVFAAGDNLLSVQENLFATVENGTDLEGAIAALPTSVSGKISDTSPLPTVEPLSYDFEDAAQLEDWTVLSALITHEDGKLKFGNNANIKAHVCPETMTGIEPGYPALQADSLPSEPPGKPWI